jgi:2-polyprenyl-3-methyl-5-hydroxy-6-metoxy-1,4-benzoquinol methylase
MTDTGIKETRSFDEARAEAFAGELLQILNNGGLTLMISIGHRTGLFDSMADMSASTSAEIAEKAGLNERYVREWLGAMVTGKIVEYNEEAGRYYFPKEHSAFLTRPAVQDNMASIAQFIPMLGAVEDDILECFKNGGGLSYDKFPRFHEAMAEESGQTVLPALIEQILPLADGIIGKLEKGINVLDVGCGAGRALVLMAKTFPNSNFVGYDFSEEAIERGRQEAEANNLGNIRFEVRDVAVLNSENKFDLITAFDSIHDQAKPADVLKGIYNTLTADGVFLMQDIAGSSHVHKNLDHPVAPLMYTISCLHCMTVSLANDGVGLGAMWGKELACEMLNDAGFNSVEVNQLEHDILNDFYVALKN